MHGLDELIKISIEISLLENKYGLTELEKELVAYMLLRNNCYTNDRFVTECVKLEQTKKEMDTDVA